MNSTVCRAKNPASCQYHGTGASSTTRILRDTMLVARSVFKIASESEKLEAYYNLQDAEEAYYGTDEGRNSLTDYINTVQDSSSKKHWLEVLERADKKREFIETQIATLADKQNSETKDSLTFVQNMRVEEYNGRKYVVLAKGSHPDGREYIFDWDQSSGKVLYEELNEIDSARILGLAKEIGSAKNLCQNWHENSKIQKAS